MRRDAALLMVLVGAMSWLSVPTARAGTYDVVACNATGAERVNRSWTLEPYNAQGRPAPAAANFRLQGAGPEKCQPAIGVAFNPALERKLVRAGDGAAWTFRAPAGTTVKRMQVWRNLATRAGAGAAPENGWWTAYTRAGTEIAGKVVFGDETCAGNAPTAPDTVWCRRGNASFSPATLMTYDVDEPVVSLALECNGPTPATLCATADAANDPNAGLDLQAAVMTIDDPVAPAVGAALPEGGYGRQSTPLVLSASDSAGIRAVKLLVDGVERFSESYACDFRRPAPCPEAVTRAFDLGGVADGRHAVTLVAEDAASNLTRSERVVDLDGTLPTADRVTVTGRRVSVRVADALSGLAGGTIEVRGKRDAPFAALKTTLRGGRLTATVPRSYRLSRLGLKVNVADKAGNALSSAVSSMSLSTRIAGARRSRKVRNERAGVPYGRPVTVLGRLTTTDGVALPGQPVVITGALRRTGATVEPIATATTDKDGRFSVPVAAGPSRRLSVTYPGAEGFLHRSRDVTLRVRARSTIRASATVLRGAGTIRFSGRLGALGTSLPPGGKLVDLQAAQRGRWSTVATTRTRGASGAWRAVARFRGTPGRFPVRLRVRREALFPYELGYSAPVVVRVR